jgi:hypothetical protein
MGADNRKDFLFRTGTFFVLIGIGMMILFGASMCAPSDTTTSIGNDLQSNGLFFLAGIISFAFGWYLKRITAPPPRPPSERFSGLRKIFQRRKKK